MKKVFLLISILANQQINTLCFAQTNNSSLKTQNYVQYVNPFIGTGGHGHTFPGATIPFGMVQLSPDTRIDGSWDGCGGYYYNDSIIYGFSHTHLSGTGCSDYGDIAFIPNYISDEMFEHNSSRYEKIPLQSTYQHKNEKAEAGYYSVLLDNGIKVELTSTPRVGLQKYSFTKTGYAYIILNLLHRDELLEGSIHQVSKTHFSGIRRSKAWAKNQTLFYDFEISKEPSAINIVKGKNGDEKLYLYFGNVKKGDEILIKTGISACDEKGALNNRTTELPGWDFEKTKKAAQDLWNKELGKIEVSNEDKNKSTIFYTALYHAMIHPSLYSDVDNRYRGRDNQIHSTEGKFDYYTVFSLWDTYRALHPLLTIIDTKRTNDFINTFLCQYQQGGRLPVWELSSNETDCMIGYHSVSVIWDAYNKGIRGFDANLAFEAMKHSAMEDRNGLKFYKEKGYISSEDDNESVSKTLEYAYDDWCIAQMAKALNKWDDYHYFSKRSGNCFNLYNFNSHFFQPKYNGGWLKNFNPYEVNNNYTEANAWQYSLSMPVFNLPKFVADKDFHKHLDSLFNTSSKLEGRNQADISGMIGQYAQGNEPSHHMAYLYNFIGKPDLTQKLTFRICNDFYKNSPDGLCGNEDCGQMSAWFVWSSIGLYPISHDGSKYTITKGLFKNVKIHSDDKLCVLQCKGVVNNTNTISKVNRAFDIYEPTDSMRCLQTNPNNYNFTEKNVFHKIKRGVFHDFNGKGLFYSLFNTQVKHDTFTFIYDKPVNDFDTSFLVNTKKNFKSYFDDRYRVSNNFILTIPTIESNSKTFNGKSRIKIFKPQGYILVVKFSNRKDTLFLPKRMPDTSYIDVETQPKFLASKISTQWNHETEIDTTYSFTLDTTCSVICYFQVPIFFSEGDGGLGYSLLNRHEFATASFTKIPFNHSLKLLSKYDNLYAAGGEDALIDLERGSENWRIGNWQGYAGKDFVGIVDVGSSKKLKSIGLGCLQDQGAWVMMPPQVIFEGSNDGKTFEPISIIKTNVSDTVDHAILKDVVVRFYKPTGQVISPEVQTVAVAKPYRYYKVIAKNYGKLPAWHWSKGEPAWLFVDEILIEE